MAAEVPRDELEARVGVLEREVEGEKVVTRHILEQTRRSADDLAGIKSRLERVERKVESIDATLNDLVRDLPIIVGNVVREVLRERGDKA